ncbi:MAG TPA: Hsp20/alpha crystallin family protein [Candidatus Dormibacteraeota bacterium]
MTAWDPWRDLFVVPSQLTPVWHRGRLADRTPARSLALDIRQTDTEFILEASLPGFTPEDIEVVAEAGTLTIQGELRTEADADVRYLHRERRRQSFFRQVALPQEIKEDEITATFVNGELTVRVPRAEAPAKTRIKVEVGSTAPNLEPAAAVEAEASAS